MNRSITTVGQAWEGQHCLLRLSRILRPHHPFRLVFDFADRPLSIPDNWWVA